jgi:MATE family multidrug resistance protein
MLRPNDVRRYGLWSGCQFDLELMLRLLRFGGPSGIPMLVESSGFTALTMFIAADDPIYSAATNLAFNVNAVAFVPMIGLGIAVSTLVGQNLTAGKTDLAERAVWTSLVIGLGYQILAATLYLSVPDWFLSAHESVAASDFVEVRNVTVFLLRFVAAYCLFDAMQIIFVGALKGAGDTLFVMLVAAIVSSSMLLIGKLTEGQWDIRAIGWWWILSVWIFILGAVYLVRFLGGRWKSLRVIEPELG